MKISKRCLLKKNILVSMAEEVVLEGREYISSKRASEITQYSQDYIGQLARGGVIDAKRVGGLRCSAY